MIESTSASATSSVTIPADLVLFMGQAKYPLQCLHKAEVFHLVTEGKEHQQLLNSTNVPTG